MIDEVTLALAHKEREEAIAHSQVAPSKFLAAWVAGVNIIGEEWFTQGNSAVKPDSLCQTTDKWQQIPNWDLVNERIGVLSSGEAALLAVMCSFYNSNFGGDLMRNIGIQGMADISGALGLRERKILSELLLNYTGW